MNPILRAARAYYRLNLRVWYALMKAIRRVPLLERTLEGVGEGLESIGRGIKRGPWLLGVSGLVGLAVFNAAAGDMSNLVVNVVALAGVTTLAAIYRWL